MDLWVGTYKHVRDENFEDVLCSAGVNFFLRKMMSNLAPTITIENGEEENSYVLKTSTPMKTVIYVFKLGQTDTQVTPKGPRKILFTEENGNLIQTPMDNDPADTKCIRSFTADGMVQEFIHEQSGTKGKRFYTRAS